VDHTYAVPPSIMRTGWWQQHIAFMGRLVPQKVTCKFSSPNNISLTHIQTCTY